MMYRAEKNQYGNGVHTLEPGTYHAISGLVPELFFCGDSPDFANQVIGSTYAGQPGSWWRIQKGQVFTLSSPLYVAQTQPNQYALYEQIIDPFQVYPDICVISSCRANFDGSYDLPALIVGGLQQLSLTIEDPATLIQTWQAWSVAPQGLAGYLSQPADPAMASARISMRGQMRW